jgi:hypothetical protein
MHAHPVDSSAASGSVERVAFREEVFERSPLGNMRRRLHRRPLHIESRVISPIPAQTVVTRIRAHSALHARPKVRQPIESPPTPNGECALRIEAEEPNARNAFGMDVGAEIGLQEVSDGQRTHSDVVHGEGNEPDVGATFEGVDG